MRKASFEKAMEYVVQVKEDEGKSNNSIKGYRTHMKAFGEYLHSQGIYNLDDVSSSHVRQFMKQERERGLKQVSLNNRIRYIRASFNILIRDGLYIDKNGEDRENPARVVKLEKEDPSSIFPIPDHLLQPVLKQPDQKTFLGKRNYVIMLLILDTGIRPSEVLEGRTDDWTDNYYTVRADVSKTKETRILPLSRETTRELYRYERIRGDWGGDRLFPNQDGERLNTDGFRSALRKICKRAGLSKTDAELVHPYAFRHTFAYNYLMAGGDVFKLQEILGHTDLAMTRRYVKLVGKDLLSAHKEVKPLSKYVKSPKPRRRI